MATVEDAIIRLTIRSLIRQLEVVEARLASKDSGERFEDLEGIWAGKADFSLEEIKEAEIKVKEFPQ